MPPARYYPAFIDIEGKPCLVVGGGMVAQRKASALLKAGARVTVVSPESTRRILADAERGRITLRKRRYRTTDMRGALLVIAATDSPEENARVADDARKAGVIINVVDTPELCDFIVPSTVNRGPLTIAISTSGASPAMARAIREELEELYGPAFGKFLSKARAARRKALAEISDPAERKHKLESLASREVIRRLRKVKPA